MRKRCPSRRVLPSGWSRHTIRTNLGSLAALCDETLERGLWLELGVQLESTDGAFPAPLRRRQLAGHWSGARAELSRFGSAAALGSLRGRLWDGAYAADYGELVCRAGRRWISVAEVFSSIASAHWARGTCLVIPVLARAWREGEADSELPIIINYIGGLCRGAISRRQWALFA